MEVHAEFSSTCPPRGVLNLNVELSPGRVSRRRANDSSRAVSSGLRRVPRSRWTRHATGHRRLRHSPPGLHRLCPCYGGSGCGLARGEPRRRTGARARSPLGRSRNRSQEIGRPLFVLPASVEGLLSWRSLRCGLIAEIVESGGRGSAQVGCVRSASSSCSPSLLFAISAFRGRTSRRCRTSTLRARCSRDSASARPTGSPPAR